MISDANVRAAIRVPWVLFLIPGVVMARLGRNGMEAVLGFQVGFWDYATFAAIFIIVVAGLSAAVFI